MCMIDHDGDDCIVLSEYVRTARKEHKCYECGAKILPGNKYLIQNTARDGEMQVFKTCTDCKAKMDFLSKECGGFVYGGVCEDFADTDLHLEFSTWAATQVFKE